MIVRPRLDDHLVIGKYTGKVIVGVGLLMLIPLAVSLGFGEWDTAVDFVIAISACMIFVFGTQLCCRTEKDMNWRHGLACAPGARGCATMLGSLDHPPAGPPGRHRAALFAV